MVTFVTVTATPGLDRVRERGLKLTPQRIAILPPTRPEKGAKDAARRRP